MEGGGIHQIGRGQITTDGEISMCLLHSLSKDMLYDDSEEVKSYKEVIKTSYNQALNLDRVLKFYGRWKQSNPLDIGHTTDAAFKIIDLDDLNPYLSYCQTIKETYQSESNGCLMRMTPQSVWSYQLTDEELYEAVKLQTAFTHSNKNALDTSYLYCLAVKILINTGDADLAYSEVKH